MGRRIRWGRSEIMLTLKAVILLVKTLILFSLIIQAEIRAYSVLAFTQLFSFSKRVATQFWERPLKRLQSA